MAEPRATPPAQTEADAAAERWLRAMLERGARADGAPAATPAKAARPRRRKGARA